jgi:hypothetical protein
MWQRCWLVSVLVLVGSALPAHGQVTLTWQWKAGDTVYLESTSTSKQGMKLMGQAMPQDSQITSLDSFRVLKDGSAVVLQRTIDAMTVQSTGPGAEANEKLVQRLRGAGFTITLDPRRQIINRLEGADAFLRKAINNDPMLQAGGTLNETNLRQEAEELLVGYLPPWPVKPGDKWRRKSQLSLGMLGSANLDGIYTYRGPTDAGGKLLERIDVTWAMAFAPPKKSGAVPGMPFQFSKVELHADSAAGTYYFDNQAGRLVRLERKLVSHGTMAVAFAGQQVQLELEQEQSLKVRAVNKPAR